MEELDQPRFRALRLVFFRPRGRGTLTRLSLGLDPGIGDEISFKPSFRQCRIIFHVAGVDVYVDDQELSLAEFGRLLTTYAGWGMRIVFVPDDRLDEEPDIVVLDTIIFP
jgi:hypothetical protein